MELFGTEPFSDTQHGRYTPIALHLDLRRSLYGLLEVECHQKLPAPAYMPVRHRFDFFKACVLFDPFGDGESYFVARDEEVLVGEPLELAGFARDILRPFMPRLQFFVEPKGYLEWMYDPEARGKPPPWGWHWRPSGGRGVPSS